ncbi:MAG: chemotaxis protein CheW [Chromatiales bacterium]|nr:chemotaxis protein CheW [Chromatiales bacterium]
MAERIGFDKADDNEDEGMLQLVGFDIGDESFGVDILIVQEIIRSATITAVPNSPEFVEGVINLRGNIIPVVDLRKRLYLYTEESAGRRAWILILNISDRVVGFIVDQVTHVIKVSEDSVQPPPEIVISGLESQYIQGVCELDQHLLVILNFSRVLFNDEYNMLRDLENTEMVLDETMVVVD